MMIVKDGKVRTDGMFCETCGVSAQYYMVKLMGHWYISYNFSLPVVMHRFWFVRLLLTMKNWVLKIRNYLLKQPNIIYHCHCGHCKHDENIYLLYMNKLTSYLTSMGIA